MKSESSKVKVIIFGLSATCLALIITVVLLLVAEQHPKDVLIGYGISDEEYISTLEDTFGYVVKARNEFEEELAACKGEQSK